MSAVSPSAGYSLTIRIEIANKPGLLGRVAVASAIGAAIGDIGAGDLVETSRARVVRDITIKARDSLRRQRIVEGLRRVPGIRVVYVSDRTFLMRLGGKS